MQLKASSIDTLKEITDKVKLRLATYPTVFDIEDSLSDGKEELQIELTEQGKALGLTRVSISNEVVLSLALKCSVFNEVEMMFVLWCAYH